MTDAASELRGQARRLPELARHPQPRGRRRRALPREDGRRAGRPRRAGSRSSAPPTPPRRPDEVVDGVRFVRRGSKLSVYLAGMRGAAPRRPRRRRTSWSTCRTGCRSSPAWSPASRWSCSSTTCTASSGRSSTPGSPAGSAGGSSAGSRRGSTGAASTSRCRGPPAASCVELGVDGPRIAVVHNGTDPRVPVGGRQVGAPRWSPWSAGWSRTSRSSTPSTPSLALRERVPGPAAARRRAAAGGRPSCTSTPRERGAGDTVVFEGHVDEERKHEVYERAWVLALPSLKEGWGLVVGEAGMHAHADGGLPSAPAAPGSRSPTACPACWSTTTPSFTTALGDAARATTRCAAQLGEGAREVSHRFTWEHAQESFAPSWPRCCAESAWTPGPRR